MEKWENKGLREVVSERIKKEERKREGEGKSIWAAQWGRKIRNGFLILVEICLLYVFTPKI